MSCGYDDQFNDGMCHVGLHNSSYPRPRQWPRSVSEMQRSTEWAMPPPSSSYESEYSDHIIARGATACSGGGCRR